MDALHPVARNLRKLLVELSGNILPLLGNIWLLAITSANGYVVSAVDENALYKLFRVERNLLKTSV